MNCQDSAITSLTKTSLLHKNSQQLNKQSFTTVYLYHQQRLRSVTLPLEPFTVQELIQQALREFNSQGIDEVSSEFQEWTLYASKKNGKKYSDLPSLDPSQKVDKTGFKHFLLCPVAASPKKRKSSGRIMTQFYAQRKLQIKAKENKSCLCFQL